MAFVPRDPRARNRNYRITLTCGCTTVLRNPPLHAGVRYGCSSGLGHGYSLAWTSWTNALTGDASANHATTTTAQED